MLPVLLLSAEPCVDCWAAAAAWLSGVDGGWPVLADAGAQRCDTAPVPAAALAHSDYKYSRMQPLL